MKNYFQFTLLLLLMTFQVAAINSKCGHTSNLPIAIKNSYSTEEQYQMICDLEDKIEKGYSENIFQSFRSKKNIYFKKCYDNITVSDLPHYKLDGLLRKCVAQFNNGHLRSHAVKAPWIYMPFSLIESSGDFYIKSLFTENTCAYDTGVKVGDIVIEINGKTVNELISSFDEYQYGSSSYKKREGSVDAITSRTYAITDNPKFSITVNRDGKELTFNNTYFFYENYVSTDDNMILLKMGYKSCRYETNTVRKQEGYYYSQPLYKPKWSFSTEQNLSNPSAFFSNITTDGKDACYLKFYNFESLHGYFDDQAPYPEDSYSVHLWSRLKTELEQCNTTNKTLIIDFQYNTGGRYSELGDFINLVTPEGSKPLSQYRQTRLKHDFMGQYLCEGEVFFREFSTLLGDTFNSAFCQDLESSSSWNSNGYDNNIIVLTTPNCMSSCDIAVSALKMLPNVKVIGTPTHGAFNGISRYDDFGKTTNGPVTLYNTDLTTFIEATYVTPIVEGNVCINYSCYRPLEGKPVMPHFNYNLTFKDLTSEPFGIDLREEISRLVK
jgi:hypothetical protein